MNSILIIDDDAKIREMLSTVLANQGYLVEAVESGKQAIKTTKKSLFDIALIDVELPDMKGTELLSRLKSMQPKMVRIIITGHPSIESSVKAVNERADGYVLKPFEVTELLEKIEKLLREKTEDYLRISKEVMGAKESTPVVKYQRPDKW